MREFQGKKAFKKILYSKVFVLFLLLIVGLMSYRVWGISSRRQVVKADKDALLAQVAELAARKRVLEKDIANLQTERGLEELIREKFPVVKEGERVITVVVSTTTRALTIEPGPWWETLWPF